MATITSSTLQDIARAVADELQLDNFDRSISVREITVAVTYQVTQPDIVDTWYDEYLRQHGEEEPF